MDGQVERNLTLAEQWANDFNSDIERLVTGLYAPDCLFSGVRLGHERLLRFERRVLAAAPNRNIRVETTHAVGDVVIVEGVLLDPDEGDEWRLPFCAVLTWQDGKVVSDNTYADMSRWPGMN